MCGLRLLCACAGGLIRHILKSLEEIGIVEKSSNVKGGRRLTGSGQRDMDLIAGRCQVGQSAWLGALGLAWVGARWGAASWLEESQ